MITHQDVAVNPDASAPTHLPEGLQEKGTIRVVEKDGFAPIAPTQHVIDRAGIFHPNTARHDASLAPSINRCQSYSAHMHGLTRMALSQYVGNSAQFWLNLQADYELRRMERNGELPKIGRGPRVTAA